MAVTGFFLFVFVVAHMLGNFQIFMGPDALNDYAAHLKELPFLLWPARIFLLFVLVIHGVVAVQLAIQNRRARPVSYAVEDTVAASYASRTMMFSGIIILAFIVYHLLHFTFGKIHPEAFELMDAKGREDVYRRVVLGFQDVRISLSYVFAMAVLCVHLSHGASSFFQSLGLSDERWADRFKACGMGVAVLIFVGNCLIPASILLGWLK